MVWLDIPVTLQYREPLQGTALILDTLFATLVIQRSWNSKVMWNKTQSLMYKVFCLFLFRRGLWKWRHLRVFTSGLCTRSPGEEKGYLLQYSGLENSMDCLVHGVTKNWTHLSDFHFQSNQEPVFGVRLPWFESWPQSLWVHDFGQGSFLTLL